MKVKFWFILILALIFAIPATSFAQEKAPTEPPAKEADDKAKKADKPKKKGADEHKLTGTWQSEWGEVEISVDGNKAEGSWSGGKFWGELSTNDNGTTVLNYDWEQPDGVKGKGYFEVINENAQAADNGRKLMGTWGFGGSPNNGGAWTLYGQNSK